jgi:hypothetical protein
MNYNRLCVSAHHGCIHFPNHLISAANIVDENSEIDIVEIDFVTFGNEVISSHDYDVDVIQQGSILFDWILAMVIERGKILWIDIKENLTIFFNWMYDKFDVSLFFMSLIQIRREISKKKQIDITPFIWIGCQDRDLFKRLKEENETLKHPWKMIFDIPTVSSYIYQYLMPSCFIHILEDSVVNEFSNVPMRQYDIISIDQSFFHSMESLVQFIKKLPLRHNTSVILNSYEDRSIEAPYIKNLNVIMQYDYRLNKI